MRRSYAYLFYKQANGFWKGDFNTLSPGTLQTLQNHLNTQPPYQYDMAQYETQTQTLTLECQAASCKVQCIQNAL